MNGSGHPIDDKYASTRTALKELPLGGLLLDRCPSSGNGLIKMVSWKMYQNGEQELHHLTGHRQFWKKADVLLADSFCHLYRPLPCCGGFLRVSTSSRGAHPESV